MGKNDETRKVPWPWGAELGRCRSAQAWQVELYRQMGQVWEWGCSFPSAGSEEEAKAKGLGISGLVRLSTGPLNVELYSYPHPQSPRRG